MTTQEILQVLESNQNERGMAHFERMNIPHMSSYGLGLTQIKKLAKGLPKNNEVAVKLWNGTVIDGKHMACLICEPKKFTPEELETMALQSEHWMLGHTFTQNVLSKSPYLKELVEKWTTSDDQRLRTVGYNGLSYLAKQDKKLPDAYFWEYVTQIKDQLQSEENFVRDAMNNALLRMGMRSKELHKTCLDAAQKIGKVEVDYGDNSCEAVDVVKHLSSDRLMSKFA